MKTLPTNIPQFVLPTGITPATFAGEIVALIGNHHEPFQTANWEPLGIPNLKRFLALSLHGHFITAPTFGNNLASIPDRCQFLLWEETDGGFGILLPVLDGDFRAEAAGVAEGLQLKCECGPAGHAQSEVILAITCLRDNPYLAIQDALRHAVQWMQRGRLRIEKRTPEWIDYLGWCTWDAFYAQVDEEKILQGLSEFQKGGVVPGHLIIDEGWQDYSDTNYLLSLGVKSGAFTNTRLQSVVQRAKQEFGVSMVGCWRTLFGELRGVDVNAPGLAQFRRRLVHEPKTESDTFGVIEPQEVPRFHDEYAARLSADGVDFVKVDFQSALHLMTYDQCGRAEGARIWQHGLQESVQKYFHGEMLNCMSMGSDEVYHTRMSNVCRASDDYFPTKDDSHPNHIRQNLYNALWLGPLQWPDWDMFQSMHPWALYHAIGRAISGGPVYVSDQPGKSDFGLLRRFVAADGKVLRCSQPAQPTRDSLFTDPVARHRMIKAFNRVGDIGLLALFHPDPNPASLVVEEGVGAWNVEEMKSGLFAVYSIQKGFLGVVDLCEELHIRLDYCEADILIFSPVKHGFAAFGLIEKFNPPAAIKQIETMQNRLILQVRGGGRLGVYSENPVGEVIMNGVTTAFLTQNGVVTLDTGDLPDCRVEIMLS